MTSSTRSAHYGRIHKTLHVLRTADDPGYRKTMKGQGTSRKAAIPWDGTSSMAHAANCASATTRAWKTNSARSAWS
jgi:hypothetical protein